LGYDRTGLEAYNFFTPVVSGVISVFGDDTILLDVSQIHRKLLDTLLNLQFDAEMRTLKGSTFEGIVSSEVRQHCKAVTFPIPDSLDLIKIGEIGPFAEADLYIAKGKFLFVVDCKAHCINNRYLKGEAEVVERRWRKVKEWLIKSDARAKMIAQNPVGGNYQIPLECEYIIPVVCSSMVEYISEDEAMTQLTESIPRICTIEELIEVIEKSDQLDFTHRPYALRIEHLNPA
jgi:hypothetical protein